MKIQQWLGFNEDSSPYILRPGELRALVNLQPRRAGMLISRPGLIKLYGKYDDEIITGLYRRDTIVGDPNDYLCFQKSLIDRTLTTEQIAAKELAQEYVWVIRRIQGFQERVIAQLPLSPNDETAIQNFCVCEDRHGRMFLFFGHGAEPLMYRPSSLANSAISMGMSAPLVAPTVVPSGDGFFIESVDVTSGGGGYYAPPTITVEGGSPSRPAKLKGIVQGGNLVGIDVIDGGANFSSFPKITVAADKVGAGFRAVGNLETDPGVQGFVSTTAGVITGTAPTSTETVGETNSVTGNRIMYESSAVSATTRTVPQANPSNLSTQDMVLESTSGIQVGDLVTLFGSTIPAAFSQATIRVLSVNSATRTVTLSKSWIPGNNVAYLAQFRSDWSVGYADATWNATTKRFRASVPLRTTKGTGAGAEATLEFSPVAYSYGLGSFTMAGYTTPTGGVESPRFAFKEVGWDSYINGDYWQGSFQDKKDSAENKTYAGLQASGSSYVFGYSGNVSSSSRGKTVNRRADVYWPDYSKISVWVCTGTLSDNINQWTRVDATVYDGNTSNPYAIVELKPTASARTSTQSGRLSYSTESKSFALADGYRYPTIKIKLKSCPNSWVTSAQTNGSFNYNLPSTEKEAKDSRIAWWHSAGITPRPIVDLARNASNAISWDSVEVIDAGAGWELGTTFGVRIHQANPYDQRTDYNTAVREQSLRAGHKPFSTSSRYAQFVFKATEADDLTPAGPPNALVGAQYVDVTGSGYRSGDTAEVTLLRRSVSAPSTSVSFAAVITGGGGATEFTAGGTGATILNLTTSTHSQIAVGDEVRCSEPNILLGFSQVQSIASPSTFSLNKMRNPRSEAQAAITGTVGESIALDGVFITIPGTVSSLIAPTRSLRDSGSGQICLIEQVYPDGVGNTILKITGQYTTGTRTFLPVFAMTATKAVLEAQTVTWTAEQIAAGTGEQRVTSIRIVSGGRNYFAPPTVLVRGGGNGYGLSVQPKVENGKITACEIIDPGRAYTTQPELFTDSTAATAVPVMRPTMRGKYRCAYRYADLSETVVGTVTAALGDTDTTLELSSMDGISPGMVLESNALPAFCKIKSVNGSQVEVNQRIDSLTPRTLVWSSTGNTPQGASVTALARGQRLESGGQISSPNGQYTLRMGPAGYLVVWRGAVGTTIFWNSNTGPNNNAYATLTSDGFLRVISSAGAVISSAALPTGSGDKLELFDDGTLALYSHPSTTCTVRDMSLPIAYSSFSPIADIDAGPNADRSHSSEMRWSIPGATPPQRADIVELWRTSADQSLVFYRLEAYGKPTDSGIEIVGSDTLNDEELFDPDRPNYAAMPVVLPNGNLNAYRFGKPRTDMSVCVAFQDRLWYGVSTSGKDANTLYYSEFDEFESCPDAYDLPIQNNQRATDSLTALVPYGSMLLAMQHAHTYSITYNTDPAIDGAIQMLTHRGCLHQRCWAMDNGVFYAVDESGIYSMDRSGNIQELSAPFRDWFTSELIDFNKREAFFLVICPKTRILRFFCCLSSRPEATPAFALCLDLDRKTWWAEYYPNSLCSAITGRPSKTRINSAIFGAVDGHLYELGGDEDHCNQTVINCVVTAGGKGYKRSPKITCPSSKGVQLKGVVSEGRLVDVLVLSGGWDCKWGVQLLTEAGDQITVHDDRLLQCVEYAPIVLDIEAPPTGGTQASAVAHFSVTERLVRDCTVAEGESFVRLRTFVPDPVEDIPSPFIAAHDGRTLCANGGAGGTPTLNGVPFRTQPIVVRIGMEAVGDFIPLNAFVSRIEGCDIYLEHPDGTPVSLLGGTARSDTSPVDGYKESGGSQTLVYFRKAYHGHIPFRLATGAMQLLNEENINRGGDSLIDRSVSLVYTPTEGKKEVEIIQYYNDSSTPRPNVMRRTRGGPGGFEHRQDSASTVLDIQRAASALADSTGVAKAMFAGRVYTDATGEDQHIQVELHGRPASANGGADLVPQRFVMHSMTINGVIENGE